MRCENISNLLWLCLKKYWQFTAFCRAAGADDFFLETAHHGSIKPQAKSKVPDSIVLTTAIISVRFFGGNQASAMLYMADKQGVTMLEKSAFNRRLHRLATTLSVLFYYLAFLLPGRFFQGAQFE